MPFQSEKQRRYLWANEPEIARDWTETYGSRIGHWKGSDRPIDTQDLALRNLNTDNMPTINIEEATDIYQPTGFNENYTFTDAYQPSFLERTKTGITKNLNEAFTNPKQWVGSAIGAAAGIPGLGFLLGAFKQSPEQKAMMDLYRGSEYQDLVNRIPGMANYNPTYMGGAGYGLTGAIDSRLGTINRALGKMTAEQLAKTSLIQRKKDLEALKALEAKKDFARVNASGRRPTAPTGDGPPGTTVKDTAASQGHSPGQAGAGTGGYSYDRGGREGYGYGLKKGGIATLWRS